MSRKNRAQFEEKLAAHGFKSYDDDAMLALEGGSVSWLSKQLSKAAMKGGRIAMPGEFFALPSANLTNQTHDNLTNLTDHYVRSGVNETFFTDKMPSCGVGVGGVGGSVGGSSGGGGVGGSAMFDQALKAYRATSSQRKSLRLSAQQRSGMKQMYNEVVDATFDQVRKAAPKAVHLKATTMSKAVAKKM